MFCLLTRKSYVLQKYNWNTRAESKEKKSLICADTTKPVEQTNEKTTLISATIM